MKMKIFRYNGDGSDYHYDTFELPEREGMTVLDALFYVQDNLDDSISFRYSCRGAVCGSCAMLINKVPRLACRTQMKDLVEGKLKVDIDHYKALDEGTEPEEGTVLVEPLPHLKVKKDLIVDMEKFFENYRKIKPTFRQKDDNPEKERMMDKEDVRELEKYTNCILCASCFGGCPVNGEDEEYLGPAALAKLYRFNIDPREPDDDYRLELADFDEGWWDCDFHLNCKMVCPKDVPPNEGIGKARAELQKKDKEE